MSAHYIFDGNEQRGPYESQQIATMWKQRLLTANAQYLDNTKQEWRAVSDLVAATAHPFWTTFKTAYAESRAKMETPEAKARQQRTQVTILICIPVLLLLGFLIASQSGTSDAEWRATVRQLNDDQARRDKAHEEAWKERNREAAQRYLRNHPEGRP
jgi:hypothetical protein